MPFAAGVLLAAFSVSGLLSAHDHVGRNVVWPKPRPVWDPGCRNQPMDPSQEVTLLMRPVKAVLDERPPGQSGVRAVRLHLRSLRNGDEETVAFERPLFRNDEEMVDFLRKLLRLMRAPIISIHFRGTPDGDSPSYNHRWRADRLPDWTEIPNY
jgi:hypothetical protein